MDERRFGKIGAADELQLASTRRDGTLRKPVTIWVVRHGDDLYVRSVNGRTSTWFLGVQDCHEGHIHAGGVDEDVAFVAAGDDVNDAIDSAHRTKYHHYSAAYVDPIVSPRCRSNSVDMEACFVRHSTKR